MGFFAHFVPRRRSAQTGGFSRRFSLSKNPKLASVARKQRFAARPAACLRPSPALRLCLAMRFMAFSHFWR